MRSYIPNAGNINLNLIKISPFLVSNLYPFVSLFNMSAMKYRILLLFIVLCSFMFIFTEPVQAQLRVGEQAPEINLPDPANVNRSLNSLNGNIVLVYFWASWDPSSRANSPNVYALYHKYEKLSFPNAQGFKLFTVSLDSDRTNWINTLNADKLPGTYHVYDFYSGTADSYKVQQLPYTYLIDAKGIIYAVNPTFNEIDKILAVDMKATQTMAFHSNTNPDLVAETKGNAAVNRSVEPIVTHNYLPASLAETKTEGITYKVQVGAFKKLNLKDFDRVAQFGKVEAEVAANQINRVMIGSYDTRAAASDALAKIQQNGFPDAFLVEYKNNVRGRVIGKSEWNMPLSATGAQPTVPVTTANVTSTPTINTNPALPAGNPATVSKPEDNTATYRSTDVAQPSNIYAVPHSTPGVISTTMPEPYISAPYTLPVTTNTTTNTNTTVYNSEKTPAKNPSVNTTTANPNTTTAIQPYKPGETRFNNTTATTTQPTTTTTPSQPKQPVTTPPPTTQPANKTVVTQPANNTPPPTTTTPDPKNNKQAEQEMLDKKIDSYINSYDFSNATNTKSNRLKNKLKRDKKKR